MHEPSLRVLLVEDNPGDARLLLEGVKEAGDGQIDVTWAESLSSGATAARQRQFDALLLDMNLPDAQGLETLHSMQSSNPNVPIVLLTGERDEATALRAVQEGAQDFLIKGVATPASVVRSIRFAVERNRSLQWHMSKNKHSPGGRVITFWGVKGGVGATTAALNCAAALASDKLVVAAELRADCGSFGAHFRKPVSTTLADLYRAPVTEIVEAQIEQRLVNTQLGFYLLFGPRNLAECHDLSPAHADRILALTSAVADTVVVDLPASAGPAHEAILHRSNCVVLVAERDDSSIFAARHALDRLRLWGVSNEAVQVALVNRSPVLENLGKERIEEQLGVRVSGVVPPAPEIFVGAMRASTPVVQFRTRSAPAAVFSQIAQRAAQCAAGPAALLPPEAA